MTLGGGLQMNFGRLQIATLWRLSKSDVPCSALVVDGERALRLIVIEGGQIVQWERFPTAASLRRRAVAIMKERRRKGWRAADEASTDQAIPLEGTAPPRRRSRAAKRTPRLISH
jgi:hypothetical protein